MAKPPIHLWPLNYKDDETFCGIQSPHQHEGQAVFWPERTLFWELVTCRDCLMQMVEAALKQLYPH